MEPATFGRGELVADRAGEPGRRAGQLPGASGQSVLGQDHRGRPERVGLDDVAPDLVERTVYLGHGVGAGLDEDLVASLELGAAEVVGIESQQLQVRAHCAVEDDDAVAQRLQVRGRGRVETAE